MKTLHLLAAAGLLTVAASAAAVDVPSGLAYSGYNGNEATFAWDATEGASGYLLNTWTLGASTVESVTCNEVVNHDNLSYTTPAVDGQVDDVVISYTVNGTEGVSPEQTVRIIFSSYDANGELLGGMEAATWLGSLGLLNELSLKQAFAGMVMEHTAYYKIRADYSDNPDAVGELVITKVATTYRRNVYAAKDLAVAGTSCFVDGLDPAKDYYATVKAVAGEDVSAPCEAVTLDDFQVTSLTEATEVTESSYTANWAVNPKATSYTVRNYEVVSGEENPAVMQEDGSKCVDGSFEAPVEVESLDGYTLTPGWQAASCLVATGMFGCADGYRAGARPIGGYLQAPSVNLSANEGKYTVAVSLQGNPGDEISVYAGQWSAETVHVCVLPEDGILAEEFDMADGTAQAVLRFESKNLKKFFIRSLSVKQGSATEFVLMEDGFDLATEGTFDDPVSVSDPDAVTARPGWSGGSYVMAEGMFGTGDGVFVGGRPYGGGNLVSPELDFVSGPVSVSLSVHGTPGDQLTVYAGEYTADGAVVIEFPEDGLVSQDFTLPEANKGDKLHFESKGLKKFLLDDIKVSQSLPSGVNAYRLVDEVTLDGNDQTSWTFSGLDPETGYAFSVIAHRTDFYGYPVDSEESAPLEVGQLSGVTVVGADSVDVTSPVVEFRYTDLSGRRVANPAAGTVVIRTSVHSDGSVTHDKLIVR